MDRLNTSTNYTNAAANNYGVYLRNPEPTAVIKAAPNMVGQAALSSNSARDSSWEAVPNRILSGVDRLGSWWAKVESSIARDIFAGAGQTSGLQVDLGNNTDFAHLADIKPGIGIRVLGTVGKVFDGATGILDAAKAYHEGVLAGDPTGSRFIAQVTSSVTQTTLAAAAGTAVAGVLAGVASTAALPVLGGAAAAIGVGWAVGKVFHWAVG